MLWAEVFALFAVSHVVGDFLFQTDWQARYKAAGLGSNPRARRALLSHLATYTLAFVPALIWLASDIGAAAIGIGALIALPHLIQDDRRLLAAYMRRVKHIRREPDELLFTGIDQSFHLLALLGAALLAAAL